MLVGEDDREISLKEFLEEQRRLELDAAAALPYKFDQCTFKLGPLRQYLHICHGCPNYNSELEMKAFCYSCAVTCHNFSPDDDRHLSSIATSSGHNIEEIWARRNYLCDCPSTGKCQLIRKVDFDTSPHLSHCNPQHKIHNFRGKYCFCDGRGWSVGDRTMYQCEICEDWYHDDCVARQRQIDTDSLQIPAEDSFEDFICSTCVTEHRQVFEKINCSEMIFCFPALSSPLEGHNASLFLNGAWRLELRRSSEKDTQLASLLKAHCLEHLIRDEEAVYSPEEDEEAKVSLYERKQE